jgi:DNA invertase Pin-like site-specific DNA recombinase
MKPHRAGVYVRISRDRAQGGAGVRRQQADCRALAERLGWEVIDVYGDNDLSAYSRKPRPEYDRLLLDLKNGEIDAIVCWHPDRLTRSLVELEGLIDLIEATGAAVASVVAGEFDLGTASGRMMARMVATVARHESEHLSERVSRQRAEAALQGRPSGGRRPYAYEADRMTVVEDEAVIVREMAQRFIAGESLRSLASDLNQRGVPSAGGGAWTAPSLRSMLSGPRIAALSVYRGEVVGKAAWPAIISVEDHERIKAVMTDPRRNKRGRPSSRLLSARVRCGVCGSTLRLSRRITGQPRYTCQVLPGRVGCGRIAIGADPLEQLITETLLAATDGPALRKVLRVHKRQGTKSALSEIARCESKLEALARDHARDRLSRREWLAAKSEIDLRLTELRGEANADALSASAALQPYTRKGALRAAWPTLDLDRRRAVLAAVVEYVTVNPASRRGRAAFEPERVDVIWRA